MNGSQKCRELATEIERKGDKERERDTEIERKRAREVETTKNFRADREPRRGSSSSLGKVSS